VLGYDESELGKGCHEKKHDEGVGEGDYKGGDEVVEQGALLFLLAGVHLLAGVGVETVQAEAEEQYGAEYLQEELILGVVDEVHYETHAEACDEGVDEIGEGCTETRDEAIPASFVEGTLYAEHADRPHRGRTEYADYQSLDDDVEEVEREVHMGD